MTINDAISLKRNTVVKINIPAARPIRTLAGDLHEAGQTYRFLGFHGTCMRLSRTTDRAKVIVIASDVSIA